MKYGAVIERFTVLKLLLAYVIAPIVPHFRGEYANDNFSHVLSDSP